MALCKNLWSLFCWVFSLSGSFLQIYYITEQYLHYETLTQLSIKRPAALAPPTLAICFSFRRVFDHYGVSPSESYNRRVFQYMALVPKIEELINETFIHHPVNYYSEQVNYVDYLTLNNYLMHGKFCYAIKLKNAEFRAKYVFNGFGGPVIYSLHFKANNLVFNTYQMFYHYSNSYSHYFGDTTSFADNHRMITNTTTGYGLRNYVSVSYQLYQSILLPPPFVTNCLNYRTVGLQSRGHCYEVCLTKETIEEFNKVPYPTVKTTLQEDYKILGHSDYHGNGSLFHEIELNCTSKCYRRDCITEDYVPNVVSAIENENIIINFNAPNQPDVLAVFRPVLPLVDYVTYILSSASFWLGFSPYVFLVNISSSKMFCGSKKPQSKASIGMVNSNPSSLDLREELKKQKRQIEERLRREFQWHLDIRLIRIETEIKLITSKTSKL